MQVIFVLHAPLIKKKSGCPGEK